MLKISYDNEGDILEIKFSDKDIAESEFIDNTGLVIDYDNNANMVSVELLSFSKRVGKEEEVLRDIAA